MKQSARKDNVFNSVALQKPSTSRFDLGHEVKMTFRMGKLVPSCCMEALPGDKFDLNFVNLIRFAPLVAPVMHRVRVFTEYFFVPIRILWSEWEEFITGTGVAAHPYITLNTVSKGDLADYLGIPVGSYGVPQDIPINAIPFAAYYKIYDEWYRDQNIIDEKYSPLISGDNSTIYRPIAQANCLNRAWEHDLFTSALPTAQQGDPVALPLVFQDNVPVEFTGGASLGNPGIIRDADDQTTALVSVGLRSIAGGSLSAPPDAGGAVYDPNGTLSVDIQAVASDLNDFREALALQGFLETTIRAGQRYFEQLMSHFDTYSPDARLQRPEFIGRQVQNVTISEVLATAQSNNDGETAEIGVGSMAGHGISVGGESNLSYTAVEHGFIIGIISVIPDTSYQDGLARHWSKTDRLSYAWPSLANLGEDAVLSKEIACHNLDALADPDAVFGYMPRYYEYRYIPSRVAGEFRDTLAFWTLGRIFQLDGATDSPELNEEFIECVPRTDIFAVTSEADHLYAQIINKHNVIRKLPRYGVPALLGGGQ